MTDWLDEIDDMVGLNMEPSSHQIYRLIRVARAAEALHDIADELCAAVDAEGEDVGGHRGSLVILGELGPATESLRAALADDGDTET